MSTARQPVMGESLSWPQSEQRGCFGPTEPSGTLTTISVDPSHRWLQNGTTLRFSVGRTDIHGSRSLFPRVLSRRLSAPHAMVEAIVECSALIASGAVGSMRPDTSRERTRDR
jgi:hypothetical protein